MWTKIKKYYLLTFVAYFTANTIKFLLGDENDPISENLYTSFIGALAVSLVAGSLYFWYDTKLGPRKREKMFAKKPFTDLFMSGFMRQGNAVIAVINGYTVVVNYTWPNGVSTIAVNVLFNSDFLSKEQMIDIRKRHRFKGKAMVEQPYIWEEGSVSWFWSYNFKPPVCEDLLLVADRMIAALIAENLPPLKLDEISNQKLVAAQETSFGLIA